MSDKDLSRKKEIILKLQKLVDADPNSEEAKNAAIRIAEICEKYNLSTADLNEDGILDSENIEEVFEPSYSYEMVAWEGHLLVSISNAFDCECYRGGKITGKPYRVYHAIIGSKSDVEIAKWFFSSLHRRIGRLSEMHSRDNQVAASYAAGMVAAISERLLEMTAAQKEVRTAETTALVLNKNQAVKDFMNNKHPNMRKARGRAVGDYGAWKAGNKAGQSMSLSRPINGDSDNQNQSISSVNLALGE